MSLYDTPSNSKLHAIAAIGRRPVWLIFALALPLLFALASLTQLIAGNEKSKARHAEFVASMRKLNEPLRKLNLAELTKSLDASDKEREVSFNHEQGRFHVQTVIHGILLATSAAYLLTSVTAIGLASLALWFASLLALCLLGFFMEIPAAEYFVVYVDYGVPTMLDIGNLVLLATIVGILLFSLIKYRSGREN